MTHTKSAPTNPPQYSISLDEIFREFENHILSLPSDEKFWHFVHHFRDEATQAINQLIYTQVLELIPEKLTDNLAFTIGEGEVPLTQFQIGYNQAIDDMTKALTAKYIGGSDE